MRYWPAGAICPRQTLALCELLRFDTEKISTSPDVDNSQNTEFENENVAMIKISMAPALDNLNDTKLVHENSTSEKISMAPIVENFNDTESLHENATVHKISMSCTIDKFSHTEPPISTPQCKDDTEHSRINLFGARIAEMFMAQEKSIAGKISDLSARVCSIGSSADEPTHRKHAPDRP
jgi:hypothetical protein